MPEVARTLRDVRFTLEPSPLVSDEEFDAFYRGEKALTFVRGKDVAQDITFELDRTPTDPPYKCFLLGRSGVGKSTEITRLFRLVERDYQPIRFDVRTQLDPRNFTPFDVVLLMMVLLIEETERVTGNRPEPSLMRDLLRWFADDKETTNEEVNAAAEAAGGVDTKNAWWGKVVGAFVTVKGSLKYTSLRKKEVVEYKLTRLDALVDTANAVLRNCAHLLKDHNGKRWLFAGESFDKTGIPSDKQIDLFLVHGATIFGGLEANLVFNLPLDLAHGSRSADLPDIPRRVIFDTPVYTAEKTPFGPGRAFVRAVLEARVDPDLFEEGQMDRFIVASGANLRDLFALVREASLRARVRGGERIAAEDATSAILDFRTEMQSRLGTTQHDATPIPNEQKVDRLADLYKAERTGEDLPSDVLRVLLAANAVQEFNGQHWFGVHPMIVDYLKRTTRIPDDAPGGLL